MSKPLALLCLGAALLGGCATREGTAALPQSTDTYFQAAERALAQNLRERSKVWRAKNVILFVGDGMGISTVTAARIFEAQRRGADGESNVLSFEAFPHLALAKTYAHDAQVPDSAPTATAMTTGVKTRNAVIGLDQRARVGDCASSKDKHVTTLWELAEQAGLATGVVTTTRMTHATPAAAYAHSPHRDWESDAAMSEEARAQGCIDIARQLVEMAYGDGLEVALGGGRAQFLPAPHGARQDGRDLTRAWLARYGAQGAVVFTQDELTALEPARARHVLGLFAPSHMTYAFERAQSAPGEPSLAAMTAKAIDLLSRDDNGFLLMVEAGRIDHGSHEGKAYLTLSETVALDEAVKAALAKVSLADTLIIVTADHSHTLTIGGYPRRNNPILGLVVEADGTLARGADGLPYTTLAFANGPGGAAKARRADLSAIDTAAPGFVQQAAVPLGYETHAGEDVAIYATGPSAHLFRGTVEQSYIFHVIDHAARLGARAAKARKQRHQQISE